MQWGRDGRAQVIRPHYEDVCATLINKPVAASSPPHVQPAPFLLPLLFLPLSPVLLLCVCLTLFRSDWNQQHSRRRAATVAGPQLTDER